MDFSEATTHSPGLPEARALLIEAHTLINRLELDKTIPELIRETAMLAATRINTALSFIPKPGE